MSGGNWAGWLAVTLAAVTLIATIAIARWQRQRKVLTYEAYTEFPLFMRNPVARDIEILADGKKLALPHVLLVTIRNAGNRALRPEDFYGPITIRFVDAEVIALQVQPKPVSLDVETEIVGPWVIYDFSSATKCWRRACLLRIAGRVPSSA